LHSILVLIVWPLKLWFVIHHTIYYSSNVLMRQTVSQNIGTCRV